MDLNHHVRTTGGALWRWFLAQTQDAIAVGLLWFVGLMMLEVRWAPLWAVLAALLQYIPHLGPVLGLLGPALAAGLAGSWEKLLYVLILYAGIVVIDGLVLQPYFMRRTARVPIWASILVPLILGLFSIWGVLLAPPLLAVFYAYRALRTQQKLLPTAEPVDAPPPSSEVARANTPAPEQASSGPSRPGGSAPGGEGLR
ncbi:MAG: AI-2E family transporter [Terriglobales bacterium]